MVSLKGKVISVQLTQCSKLQVHQIKGKDSLYQEAFDFGVSQRGDRDIGPQRTDVGAVECHQQQPSMGKDACT